MVYRVPRQHGVRRGRKQFIEAAQSVGEEAIALEMFKPTIDKNVPRCECFDSIYGQGETLDCPICYGTTIRGGVKSATRIWAIFTDTNNSEDIRRRGEYLPDEREVQFDSVPTLYQHDYIVRVKRWDNDIPLEVDGRYVLRAVNEHTLRVGKRFGQQEIDKIGQRTRIQRLTEDHVIYQYQLPPLTRRGIW